MSGLRVTPSLLLAISLLLAACAGDRGPAGRNGATTLESVGADGHLRMARRLEDSGDLRPALGFYRQADEKRPNDPEILSAMANVIADLGDLAGAAELWRRALVIAPDHPGALVGTASQALLEGRGREAVALVTRMHDKTAPTAKSLNLLGIAYDIEGEHGDAQRAYAEALVLAPDDPDILGNLALSMAVAGDSEAARDILRNLSRDSNHYTSALGSLALVAAIDAKTDEAVAYAAEIMSPEQAYANKSFYRAIAELRGIERARAVFLGELPGQAQPEPDKDNAVLAADIVTADGAASVEIEERSPGIVPTPSLAEPQGATFPGGSDATTDVAMTDQLPEYHLQLGAFSSLARLKRGWAAISSLGTTLGLEPWYEEVEQKEGHIFRLLAGPVRGFSEGRAMCSEIIRQSGACVVIPARPAPLPLAGIN